MKRALIVLGLSAATLFSASCGKDEDPKPGPSVGPPPDASFVDGQWVLPPGDGGTGLPPIVEDDAGGVVIIDGNAPPFEKDATGASGLDAATITGLKGATGPCAVKINYPYEGTVFPGALISPPIMWEGASEAAYVKVAYDNVTTVKYEFAAKVTNGALRIPQADWNQITARTKFGNLVVTLNTKTGGAFGTCQLKVRVAQGNMVGALYYNTYNHPMAGGLGAVLKLTLGRSTPEVYLNTIGTVPTGPCVSCHSVSADGSTMAASTHMYSPFGNFFRADAFTLAPTPQPKTRADLADATFGALTPDGSLLLQMGNPQCTNGADAFPRAPNNFFLAIGPATAQLIDTKTGKPVQATGLNKDFYMWMPQFSPDGTRVVFNHAKPDGQGGTNRRELAVMDFNQATRTFSNLRVIASNLGPVPNKKYQVGVTFFLDGLAGNVRNQCSPELTGEAQKAMTDKLTSCDGPCYPAWPFFTPDSRGVVFSLISEPDFAVAFPGRHTASKSELWYANIDDPAAPKTFKLDNANKGLAGESLTMNYYPTMLPVGIGGYYWMFWTSMRKFGNVNLDNPTGAIAERALYGDSAGEAFRKRIWVTAIRAPQQGGELQGGGITADPSFPGFYLEGQSETGNTRAFATLNPCKTNGNECTTGLDCCTGICEIQPGAPKGVCADKKMCSKAQERCATTMDCCPPASAAEPALTCINKVCSVQVPIL